MQIIKVKSHHGEYEVLIENHLLDHLDEYLEEERFYVIVADDHIPEQYVKKVKEACDESLVIRFPEGEKSKSIAELTRIIEVMLQNNVKKDACLIALGGGVTGDLAGLVASLYYRGIPYIQIPTTLLAQIDSSVGGKLAVDASGVKNAIGVINPPQKVFIDPSVLKTLSKRQFANGIAEMIKYGMIADLTLFQKLESGAAKEDWESCIAKSIDIKRRYVELDEFDQGIRQSLNFGHTIGHAIESYYHYEKYLHGEAVAIGMMRILSNQVIKERLKKCLEIYGLPTEDPVNLETLKPYINLDKKNRKDFLKIVDISEIGKAVIVKSKFTF